MSRIRTRTGKDRPAARAGAAGLILVLLAAGTFAARLMGYKLGRETIVRCRDGHLFTTIWIPGASIKAVRLGMRRWQRCPVGKHWTLVSPVRDADLTDTERELAAHSHDVRVP
ncbi:MAG TPA: hypothetical protein VFU74_06605 [Actinocrinis sp.]|nr:hypothetical protein [Actinocrinis sp.]